MPTPTIIAELEAGAELIVRYVLLDGAHWHFQSGELISTEGRVLGSYPSPTEASRLLGSELRPALARLKAVLDRVRLTQPDSFTAEARLQRLSLSFLVGEYAVFDDAGQRLSQWHNPALPSRGATVYAGKLAIG